MLLNVEAIEKLATSRRTVRIGGVVRTACEALARNEEIAAVAEGSNLDDNGDSRPGLQAVAKLGIFCATERAA